ncbi:MAG: sulfatase [Planctomycetota bacterium]|jgi:arylsulfatase A-like enzyme
MASFPSVARGRGRRTPLLAVLLLGVAVAAGCSGENGQTQQADRETPRSSLIWISLDTLRADHLGIYGYHRDTSPFLDELARRGLYFDWAISPQNTTLPVHVTMFMGYHPTVHQIMYSRRVNPGVRINSSAVTLPQLLQDAGFATRAWVDGGKMAAVHGFDRGFDVYDDEPKILPRKLSEVLDYLDDLDPERPSFCLIHTYQMHHPYPAPEPDYAERYVTVTEGPRPEAIRKLDLYDGCIRFTDDQLRWFVGELEQRGILDSTILVITGDHGESFAEYGIDHVGHASHNLHQNITRVPWIMLHPDPVYRGRRVTAVAGLIDFPNTVLALLGVDAIMPGGGVNVLDPEATEDRAYLSWTPDSVSLYCGQYHLVQSDEFTDPQSNALYRFTTDPREATRLEDPETAAAMRERLAALRAELEAQSQRYTASLREFGPPPEPTGKLWKQLRALGYIQ